MRLFALAILRGDLAPPASGRYRLVIWSRGRCWGWESGLKC